MEGWIHEGHSHYPSYNRSFEKCPSLCQEGRRVKGGGEVGSGRSRSAGQGGQQQPKKCHRTEQGGFDRNSYQLSEKEARLPLLQALMPDDVVEQLAPAQTIDGHAGKKFKHPYNLDGDILGGPGFPECPLL